ncbi:hypothetical protein GEOBRER4_n3637 [Citrifermentans bremense]|uniref:Uncharacterized protein n=1 Tax=Citrifermentans bremense TaxID=60035 RepID=A0A7R7IYV0_9BACT|nr:hypothetical protein GEOBRER4_n3637 [Citrifermentans bremense]
MAGNAIFSAGKYSPGEKLPIPRLQIAKLRRKMHSSCLVLTFYCGSWL